MSWFGVPQRHTGQVGRTGWAATPPTPKIANPRCGRPARGAPIAIGPHGAHWVHQLNVLVDPTGTPWVTIAGGLKSQWPHSATATIKPVHREFTYMYWPRTGPNDAKRGFRTLQNGPLYTIPQAVKKSFRIHYGRGHCTRVYSASCIKCTGPL